ncbi:MAG: HypC/HybG/HupF family hydrogenase formation chaperone [Candidatus Coatesbacteria bacterium]
MCLAIPGRITSVTGEGLVRAGRVDFGGVAKVVSLACVPAAGVGDYVYVHVGFAISALDAAEARKVFDYLKEAGELDDADTPP